MQSDFAKGLAEGTPARALMTEHTRLPAHLRGTATGNLGKVGNFLHYYLFPKLGFGSVHTKKVEHEGKCYYAFLIATPFHRIMFAATPLGAYMMAMSLSVMQMTGQRGTVEATDEDIGTCVVPQWARRKVVEACADIAQEHDKHIQLVHDEILRLARAPEQGELPLEQPTKH